MTDTCGGAMHGHEIHHFRVGEMVFHPGLIGHWIVREFDALRNVMRIENVHGHIETHSAHAFSRAPCAPARLTPPPTPTPPPSGNVAHGILTEAAGIVKGERNATHGDKERSFQVIADHWNAYLSGRKNPGPMTPRDVAAFMVLLKLARSIQGQAVRDHFVDAAGYAAIAGELSS